MHKTTAILDDDKTLTFKHINLVLNDDMPNKGRSAGMRNKTDTLNYLDDVILFIETLQYH